MNVNVQELKDQANRMLYSAEMGMATATTEQEKKIYTELKELAKRQIFVISRLIYEQEKEEEKKR